MPIWLPIVFLGGWTWAEAYWEFYVPWRNHKINLANGSALQIRKEGGTQFMLSLASQLDILTGDRNFSAMCADLRRIRSHGNPLLPHPAALKALKPRSHR